MEGEIFVILFSEYTVRAEEPKSITASKPSIFFCLAIGPQISELTAKAINQGGSDWAIFKLSGLFLLRVKFEPRCEREKKQNIRGDQRKHRGILEKGGGERTRAMEKKK